MNVLPNMLPNAYAAGREGLVRCLVGNGFVLHASYTSLLSTASQKNDYPSSLLDHLLDHEQHLEQPFGDCSKEDVYEQCIRHCCSNNRDDLVELFLKRGATVSVETVDRYTSCIGLAMARIGCDSYFITNSRNPFRKFVDICWQHRGLLILDGKWLSESNLGASVVRLDVSGNRLYSIPHSLLDGTLPWLEELDCSQNKLRSLWSEDYIGCLPREYR